MPNIPKKIITPVVVAMIGVAGFLVIKNVIHDSEEPLIKSVSILTIVADTSRGTKVTDANRAFLLSRTASTLTRTESTLTRADSSWKVRLKIVLNQRRLPSLSSDGSLLFDSTLIDFRGSSVKTIAGFDFSLKKNTLKATFIIPAEIPNWNWEKDPIVLIVKVTAPEPLTRKASIGLPLSTLAPESVTGERKINDDIYNEADKKEPNKFRGEFKDGKTRNGLTNGSDICDPDDPEWP